LTESEHPTDARIRVEEYTLVPVVFPLESISTRRANNCGGNSLALEIGILYHVARTRRTAFLFRSVVCPLAVGSHKIAVEHSQAGDVEVAASHFTAIPR